MAKATILEAVAAGVVVCDGAMGTQLMSRGLPAGECGMRWNTEQPERVLEVHQAYRRAGCRLITANSFSGCRTSLARHGLAERLVELNRAAVELAAQAAGADGWVLGDVGPFGDFLEPVGDTTSEQLEDIFAEQIGVLVAAGADAILVETMSDPAEAVVGVRAAKRVARRVPVVATFAFQKAAGGLRTMMGTTVAAALAAVREAGADIVGANCGTDLTLDDYARLGAELVAAAAGTPVIVQPNAGAPRTVEGKLHYEAQPAELAELARQLRAAGVRVIGGCCGTSPAHLAAMAAALA